MLPFLALLAALVMSIGRAPRRPVVAKPPAMHCVGVGFQPSAMEVEGQISLALPYAFACGDAVVHVGRRVELLGLGEGLQNAAMYRSHATAWDGLHVWAIPATDATHVRLRVRGTRADLPGAMQPIEISMERREGMRQVEVTVWLGAPSVE